MHFPAKELCKPPVVAEEVQLRQGNDCENPRDKGHSGTLHAGDAAFSSLAGEPSVALASAPPTHDACPCTVPGTQFAALSSPPVPNAPLPPVPAPAADPRGWGRTPSPTGLPVPPPPVAWTAVERAPPPPAHGSAGPLPWSLAAKVVATLVLLVVGLAGMAAGRSVNHRHTVALLAQTQKSFETCDTEREHLASYDSRRQRVWWLKEANTDLRLDIMELESTADALRAERDDFNSVGTAAALEEVRALDGAEAPAVSKGQLIRVMLAELKRRAAALAQCQARGPAQGEVADPRPGGAAAAQ